MEKETWKNVKGYDGLYEVSNLGRIRSLGRICNSKNNSTQKKKARILTQEITVHGYCRVRLFDANGTSKHYAVHRLVLSAFVGDSSLQVNHINEIKTDNRLVNLEYVTPKKNCEHGTRNQRISENNKGKNVKGVLQISKDGNIINTFSSRAEAQTATGVDAGHIGSCCAGKRKTANGYIWRDA